MKNSLRNIKENIIYLIIWLVLFIAPVISMYARTSRYTDLSFNWTEIMHVWHIYLVFLILFIIHNFLIAPLLVYKGKKMLYLLTVACLLTIFVTYQCSIKPAERHPRPPMEHHTQIGNPHKRPHDGQIREFHPDGRRHLPPIMPGERHIVDTFIMFLLLGMNLGVKLYFKNESDKKEMSQLKTENLEQQLEYLKHQINPHFFMNTLNNIHALVDIAPEKAKKSIIELSKMMRYILYEGNNTIIPLQREVDFMEHYLELMRMRFTDNVAIETHLPKTFNNEQIPPLLFISFVENAFKHGVSYNTPSFIHINIHAENGTIHFKCRNSKHTTVPNGQQNANGQNLTPREGGVGLVNVQKRLDLIYHDSYTLDLHDGEDTYEVVLTLPAQVTIPRPTL